MFSNTRTCTISMFIVFLLIITGCQTLEPESREGHIDWRTLKEGKIEAGKRNMPALVDFYFGEGCHRCMVLQEKVYAVPEIAEKINRRFVPIRVSLADGYLSPEERQLMDRMGSGGECILLFLDQEGEVVESEKGAPICSMSMIEHEQFLDYLDQALKELANRKN